ncbi:hypothetical protein [Hydrogenimonas sp.]
MEVPNEEIQTLESMIRQVKNQIESIEMMFRTWSATAQQIIFTLEYQNRRLAEENEALKERLHGNGK